MKKMMYAAVFSVSLLLPCWLNAQEAEPDNEEETSEAPETPQKEKKGKPAKTEKTGGNAETAEAAAQGDGMAKDSALAKQQKRIEKLQNMLKKAKKNSERRRYDDALKLEQHKLQMILKRKTDPLKAEIPRLQEQLRLCGPESKAKLKKKLAETEERLKALEAEANLEKWCPKSESAGSKNGPALDSGSGKKSKRSKKKK